MRKLSQVLLLLVVFLSFCRITHAQQPDNQQWRNQPITVSYAAGLNSSMHQIIEEFKKAYPQIRVTEDSGGTLLLIRKITELNQSPDLIFVADTLAIKEKLIPAYADWYIKFYKDRIVLAYTDKSRYTNEIDSQNWYKILLRKDVRFGYANPNLAPVGYRTLLCWQLADLFYRDKIEGKSIYAALKDACLAENILPDVAELLHPLESLSLDYVFVYESVAQQHNLKYIRLPKEIDLGSEEMGEFYKQVKVEVISRKSAGKEVVYGAPIAFGLTLLKDAVNVKGATEFIKFFLGSTGQKILKDNYQTMLNPPLAYNSKNLPDELKTLVGSEDTS